MQIDDTTSAGRLYAIVKSISSIQVGTAREAFAKYFKIEQHDIAALCRRQAEILDLIAQVESEVGLCEGINHELYLMGIPKVREVMSFQGWNDPWKNGLAQQVITNPAILQGIAFCAELLAARSNDKNIARDALADISSLLNDLSQLLVTDTTLPPSFRETLMLHVAELRYSVDMYAVRGNSGIDLAIDGAVGSMFRHGDEYVQYRDQKPVSMFEAVLTRMDQATALARGSRKLLGEGSKIAQLMGKLLHA